jgi:excisionase family DNA binding protein
MTVRCRKGGEMESQVAVDRPLAVSFARAAELTSISKSSLRRYAREGRLKVVRCGRRRIVPFTALTELLRDGLNSSPETP